jgi:hypothetical protein
MLYLNTELAEQAAERADTTTLVPVQQSLFWQQTSRQVQGWQSLPPNNAYDY